MSPGWFYTAQHQLRLLGNTVFNRAASWDCFCVPDSHSHSDHLSPVFESRREPRTRWDSALEVLHADAILPQVRNPSLGLGQLVRCACSGPVHTIWQQAFAFGTLSDWLVKKKKNWRHKMAPNWEQDPFYMYIIRHIQDVPKKLASFRRPIILPILVEIISFSQNV